MFEKLYKFIGKSIKSLVDRADEPHCFRLQRNKVYYVKEKLMKKATNVGAGGGAGVGVFLFFGGGGGEEFVGWVGRVCCCCMSFPPSPCLHPHPSLRPATASRLVGGRERGGRMSPLARILAACCTTHLVPQARAGAGSGSLSMGCGHGPSARTHTCTRLQPRTPSRALNP